MREMLVPVHCSFQTSTRPHQIDVFKDFSGAVHLPQDGDHLVVYELLKLPQVTNHLHLQLRSDLVGRQNKNVTRVSRQSKLHLQKQRRMRTKKTKNSCCIPPCASHLLTGDVLQVLLHHDLSEAHLDQPLRALPLCGPAHGHTHTNLYENTTLTLFL